MLVARALWPVAEWKTTTPDGQECPYYEAGDDSTCSMFVRGTIPTLI